MPKETFYNLDVVKQKTITDAAIDEFTEHELHKCRVSSIIKRADIPRGSFYQYFEDLDDLYYYVIDNVFESIFVEGKKYAELTNDLFEYIELTFEIDIDRYMNDKRQRFMMNVVNSIGSNNEYLEQHNYKRTDYIVSVLQKMDLSSLQITTESELIKLYEFLQDIKRMVIQQALNAKSTKYEAMEMLRWYLNIVKNGLLKDEDV